MEMIIFVLKMVILSQSPELWVLTAHYLHQWGSPSPTSLGKPRLRSLQGGREAMEVAEKTGQETRGGESQEPPLLSSFS